jgi:hypothetical protein
MQDLGQHLSRRSTPKKRDHVLLVVQSMHVDHDATQPVHKDIAKTTIHHAVLQFVQAPIQLEMMETSATKGRTNARMEDFKICIHVDGS